ncbi:uncharacterized protein N7503_002189 [Penicillium pulvis]|uniref:uncharacterized protein n=1 Tax=Penicillium pulvis TaxID=1562058 RepID=UPI0025491201|nr:uncharacterized protein N7503_002189 [Penicillium pulvis]KAJ5809971.1 hypothetical protein N7503_002189 [Penicillium pulvis]
MSEKSPIAPHSHIKRPYQELWISRCKPPLFWGLIQRKSVEEKLANMKAAIASGADVNELDHAPNPRRGCGHPLDMAVKEDDCNWEDLKHNIPLLNFS